MDKVSSGLPKPLYRAAQVRALDRMATEKGAISESDLMERAGQAVFDVMRTCWPQARRIAVVLWWRQ